MGASQEGAGAKTFFAIPMSMGSFFNVFLRFLLFSLRLFQTSSVPRTEQCMIRALRCFSSGANEVVLIADAS